MSCHVSVGITTQTQVLCSNKSSPTTKHIFEYQVLRHYLISTFFHFIATLWDKAVSVLHSTLTNTEKTAFTNAWPSCFSLFTMQCSGCVWCQECSIIVLPPVLFPVRAIRAVPLTGDEIVSLSKRKCGQTQQLFGLHRLLKQNWECLGLFNPHWDRDLRFKWQNIKKTGLLGKNPGSFVPINTDILNSRAFCQSYHQY